jgi:hypothetical protein
MGVFMKIVEQTPNKLTFKRQSLLSALIMWFFGGIFVLTGIAPISFLEFPSFSCQRLRLGEGKCNLMKLKLVEPKATEIPLKELRRAMVQTNFDSDDISTYQVVILTRNGDFLFSSSSYTDQNEQQAIAFQINNFLDNPSEERLTVHGNIFSQFNGTIISIALMFILFGTSILLGTESSAKMAFDKKANILTFQEKYLFRNKIRQYQLHEIIDVELIETKDSDGDIRYDIELFLRSGKNLPLDYFSHTNDRKKQQVTACIRNFLNLPN